MRSLAIEPGLLLEAYMPRWLLLSRPLDALVRLALRVRAAQVAAVWPSDAEATSKRD